MKYCYTCSTHKDESDFHISRAKYDGLQTRCKACKKKYNHNYAVARYAAKVQRERDLLHSTLNQIQGAP